MDVHPQQLAGTVPLARFIHNLWRWKFTPRIFHDVRKGQQKRGALRGICNGQFNSAISEDSEYFESWTLRFLKTVWQFEVKTHIGRVLTQSYSSVSAPFLPESNYWPPTVAAAAGSPPSESLRPSLCTKTWRKWKIQRSLE